MPLGKIIQLDRTDTCLLYNSRSLCQYKLCNNTTDELINLDEMVHVGEQSIWEAIGEEQTIWEAECHENGGSSPSSHDAV